ncbi:MAG: hypothetical protein ACYCWW_19375 [Deltaproteobacteria bacterium]
MNRSISASLVVAALLFGGACVVAPPARVASRSYQCDQTGGCTVAGVYYAPGVVVPVACGAGIVVVGCGCGGPSCGGVVVACGGPACGAPACGGCGGCGG